MKEKIALALLLLLVAILAAWAVGTCFPDPAYSYELPIRWGPPHADADTCAACWSPPDSSGTCPHDTFNVIPWRGTHIWLVNFAIPRDTLDLGEFDPSVKGISVTVPDGMAGEKLAKHVNVDGVMSCNFTHVVFTTPAVNPPATSGNGLLGEYFTYSRWDLFKVKLGERADTTINFDWGAGAIWPTGPADYSSLRETGTLTFPVAGPWSIYISADDGRQLELAGILAQDYLTDRSDETVSSGTYPAGPVPIVLRFYEAWGTARLKLSWSGPGVPKQVVPASALNH